MRQQTAQTIKRVEANINTVEDMIPLRMINRDKRGLFNLVGHFGIAVESDVEDIKEHVFFI